MGSEEVKGSEGPREGRDSPRGRTVCDVEVSIKASLGSYHLNGLIRDLVSEARLRINRDMITNGAPKKVRIRVEVE